MDYDPLRRGFAEFVGTFALIFVGAGTILTLTTLFEPAINGPQAAGVYSGLTLVSVAFAHGLVIAVMASAVGHISGGHFNPAITLGFLVTRRIAPSLAVVYWAVQFLVPWPPPLCCAGSSPTRPPAHQPGRAGGGRRLDHWQALVIERVLTFFLVWVVFATAVDPGGAFKSIAGLAIGLTITFDIFLGGPLSGAAMNPARAFGPELISRHWNDAWVWYVGPFGGAVVAALAYDWLYLRPPRPEPVGPPETGVLEPRPGDAAAS